MPAFCQELENHALLDPRMLTIRRDLIQCANRAFPQYPRFSQLLPQNRYSVTSAAGISSQVLPSSSRPVLFFCTPPHCLKKNATPALTH